MKVKLRAPALVLGWLTLGAFASSAAEPSSDPARVRPCDRECRVEIMDRDLEAMRRHDANGPPFGPELHMTQKTAPIEIVEGISCLSEGVNAIARAALCRVSGTAPPRNGQGTGRCSTCAY